MKFRVEKTSECQWPMVSSWWGAAGMKFFKWSDLPKDTSYIAYMDNEPVLSVSLNLMNSKFVWVEAFVGNPEAKGAARRKSTKLLLGFLEGVAKDHGASKLICFGPCPELTEYYRHLGFEKTATVDTLIKEII